MTGSRFSGLGLARYEDGLSIENGVGADLNLTHRTATPSYLAGTATHFCPVAFGDLNIDMVDIGAEAP